MKSKTMSYLYSTAAIFSALTAGVYLSFSSFIIDALQNVPPEHGISVLQEACTAAFGSLFMFLFLATSLLALVLGVRAGIRFSETGSKWIIAGSIVYLLGVTVGEFAINAPMIENLLSIEVASPTSASTWADFLDDWPFWNHIRTLSGTAAAVCYLVPATLANQE